MSDVIGFADFLKNRVVRTPHATALRPRHQPTSFTRRDREDLDNWASSEHRVSICSSDMGSFAMVYRAGTPWASWGMVRQGRSVLLWDCVTLADIGRFPSMIDALTALPTDITPAPVENIIHFAATTTRAAVMR